MNIDTMPFGDGMSIGGCLGTTTTEEFAAGEAAVDVWGGFECYGAGGFEVEVEEGAVDGVEVGTG